MTPRRIRTETLFVSAALAGALAMNPALAAWVHPSVAGPSSSTAPRIGVNSAGSKALSASASNPSLGATATGAGISVVTTTTTTNVRVKADGSSTTTTQTITTYGSATSITVSVNLTQSLGAPARPAATAQAGPFLSHTFTFSSLNAGPQSTTVGNGFYTITATPNPAGNAVAITYGLTNDGPAANSMTLNLAPPAPTQASTTTSSAPPVAAPIPPHSNFISAASSGSEELLAEVRALSHVSQTAIEACNKNTPPCIADALEAYADKLEALAPRLPERLRALPTIVREAARGVRAARSRTEAVNAVKSAIAQVNKTIALLKAEDPDAAKTGVPVGRAVDQTLEVAEVKLLRSTGL